MIKKPPVVRKPPLAQEQTPRPSTQQFNATPRFNLSSTPRPYPTHNVSVSTPSSTRYLTPARQVPKQDDIIDPSSDSLLDVHESIEIEDQELDAEFSSADLEDDYLIEERSPKRQRLSSPVLADVQVQRDREQSDEIKKSCPLPVLSSPPAPRRLASTAPRFLISTPAPQSTPQPNQSTFVKPPRFRPPASSEKAHSSEPLPDQFSPHRRGQKYVAGGLAAEVRDWLFNIESTGPGDSLQKKESPWLLRLVIDELSGGGKAGMTLVQGRKVHTGTMDGPLDTLVVMRVILAGEGAGTGLQKGSKVQVGKTVGIKGPVWEVVMEGQKWGVGVDWQVL